MTKIWIVTATSESGDDFGPLAFSKKPSESLKKKIAHSWDGSYVGTGNDGPGDYGSYVYLSLEQVEIDKDLDYYRNLKEPEPEIGEEHE